MGLFKRKNKESKKTSKSSLAVDYPVAASLSDNEGIPSRSRIPLPERTGRPDGGLGYKSDDECCYYNRQGQDVSDCCTDIKCCGTYGSHGCHIRVKEQEQDKGTVEVYHTTYACYDPNCSGGSTCKQWSTSNNGVVRGGAVSVPANLYRGNQMIHPQGAAYSGRCPMNMGEEYRQQFHQDQFHQAQFHQNQFHQPPYMTATYADGAFMPTTYGTPSQPYLVNRRPVPVLAGSVPVVVPTNCQGYGSAAVVGTVPTVFGYSAYNSITPRPI